MTSTPTPNPDCTAAILDGAIFQYGGRAQFLKFKLYNLTQTILKYNLTFEYGRRSAFLKLSNLT